MGSSSDMFLADSLRFRVQRNGSEGFCAGRGPDCGDRYSGRNLVQSRLQRPAENLADRDNARPSVPRSGQTSDSTRADGGHTAFRAAGQEQGSVRDVFPERQELGRAGDRSGTQPSTPPAHGRWVGAAVECLEYSGSVAPRLGYERRRHLRSRVGSSRSISAPRRGDGKPPRFQSVVFREEGGTFASKVHGRRQSRVAGVCFLPRLGESGRPVRDAFRAGLGQWAGRRHPYSGRSQRGFLSLGRKGSNRRPGASEWTLELRLCVRLSPRSNGSWGDSSLQPGLRGGLKQENRCPCGSHRHHTADTMRILT